MHRHPEPGELFSHLLATRPPRDAREVLRGVLASVLAHAALISLIVWLGLRTGDALAGDAGVGDGVGPGRAGGGGGGSESITLIELAGPAVAERPEPELPPAPEPPRIALAEPALVSPSLAAEQARAALPASGAGGTGTGQGTGAGPGTGPGSGGGSGGGEGGGIGSGVGPGMGRGRVLAPSPTTILMPPTATARVRGRTILVRLDVDSAGVVRGVELIPPTGDGKYDAALRKVALGWRFRPARDAANRPVAATFDFSFTF